MEIYIGYRGIFDPVAQTQFDASAALNGTDLYLSIYCLMRITIKEPRRRRINLIYIAITTLHTPVTYLLSLQSEHHSSYTQ